MGLDWKFKDVKNLALAMQIPLSLLATPLVGFFIGVAIDYLFHCDPWGKVAFIFIGFAAGVVEAIRIAGKMK